LYTYYFLADTPKEVAGGWTLAAVWFIGGLAIIASASALWLAFSRNVNAMAMAMALSTTCISLIIAFTNGLFLAGMELFCIGTVSTTIIFLSNHAFIQNSKRLRKLRLRSLLLPFIVATSFSAGLIFIFNRFSSTSSTFSIKPVTNEFAAFLVGNYDGMIFLQAMGLLILTVTIGVMQLFNENDQET